MRFMLTGSNNGMLIASLSVLQRRGWKSTSKLVRARSASGSRNPPLHQTLAPNVRHEASRYAFTDTPIPARIAHGIRGCGRRRMAGMDAEAKRQEKTRRPAEGKHGSSRRKATVPPEGKQGKKRVPPEGKQENAELLNGVNQHIAVFRKNAELSS
jgi:hypothetical protein